MLKLNKMHYAIGAFLFAILLVLFPIALKYFSEGSFMLTEISYYHISLSMHSSNNVANNTANSVTNSITNSVTDSNADSDVSRLDSSALSSLSLFQPSLYQNIYKNNDKYGIFYSGYGIYHKVISLFTLNYEDYKLGLIFLLVLNLVLAGLSALLFYLICCKIFINNENRQKNRQDYMQEPLFALIFLITSPLFILQFSTFNQSSLAFAVFLVSIYSFLSSYPSGLIISAIAALMILPISLSLYFGLVVCLFLITTLQEKKNASAGALCFMLLGIGTVITLAYKPSFIDSRHIQYFPFGFFSDLGVLEGFGIFHVLMALVGIIAAWKLKRRYFDIYLAGILLLLAYFFRVTSLSILLNSVFAILAGFGAQRLLELKWESQTVKYLASMLVLCGIIFSFVSFSVFLQRALPDAELTDFLQVVYEKTDDSIILSHWQYGLSINSIANRRVIGTTLVSNQEVTDPIFYSRNYDNVRKLLNQSSISYIIVSDEMKHGLVWESKDQGLLFLLGKAPAFSKVAASEHYELWKVN